MTVNKIDLTIPFDDDKLDALTHFLKKKNTTPLKELAKAMETLYEQNVPKDVREYIEGRSAPASRPKPKPAPKPATAVAAVKEEVKKDGG